MGKVIQTHNFKLRNWVLKMSLNLMTLYGYKTIPSGKIFNEIFEWWNKLYIFIIINIKITYT